MNGTKEVSTTLLLTVVFTVSIRAVVLTPHLTDLPNLHPKKRRLRPRNLPQRERLKLRVHLNLPVQFVLQEPQIVPCALLALNIFLNTATSFSLLTMTSGRWLVSFHWSDEGDNLTSPHQAATA